MSPHVVDIFAVYVFAGSIVIGGGCVNVGRFGLSGGMSATQPAGIATGAAVVSVGAVVSVEDASSSPPPLKSEATPIAMATRSPAMPNRIAIDFRRSRFSAASRASRAARDRSFCRARLSGGVTGRTA